MRHEDLAAARGLREARWKVSHERSGTAQRYEPVVPIGSLHCSISSGSLNVIVPSGSKAEAGSRTNRRSTLSDLYIGLKRGLVNLRKILNSKRPAVNASPIQGGASSSPAPSRSLATRVLRGAFILPPLAPNARREFPVAVSTTKHSPVVGSVHTTSPLDWSGSALVRKARLKPT